MAGSTALQVAMPMGGIGAGCICLNGYGGLQDFSIRNSPALTALPDGHGHGEAAFALLHIKNARPGDARRQPVIRLLEGPLPPEKIYDQGLQAQGYRHGGHEGLPRFQSSRFTGEYPFGEVTLMHPQAALQVTITGWSPFIPLDDINSGIPCAILEYTFQNHSEQPVEFEFSYHLSHLAVGRSGWTGTRNRVISGGCAFFNTEPPHDETFGSAALAVVGHEPRIKAMWFRGGWFDALSVLWREVSEGRFRPNEATGEGLDGRNGGSILLVGSLAPGEKVTYPVIIAWHFPNCYLRVGGTQTNCNRQGNCDCGGGGKPLWRPFYTTQWDDAAEVADYVRRNYSALRSRTTAFKDALFSSTLPPEVIDAVSANLAILKSPTILRQENGELWGWEGCFAESGCCHGTCTHVWNYAQSIPHLFPQLERTLREQELLRSMDQRGHVAFRSALPSGPAPHKRHAAADGQLGGIMKLYRDWQIGGDTQWLRRLYPLARRSLDYCIDTWDPDRRGALFEPHHNTYDIEFWGPDGMCCSIYLGALAAMAEMAREVGDEPAAGHYRELAGRGAAWLDQELFNGEYFEQKVMWRELRDRSIIEQVERGRNPEAVELLQREGPKYQYGAGCLSDGVIGAWMAKIYGIDTPQNRDHVRSSLAAIFCYNFKSDLSDHACTQRPGYAIGDEAGLLVCTWPRGGKPTLPFVYSDEVWTGIEYQVASHLIAEGMVEEGLTIVRAVRARYNGRIRNPFNEYECGSYYARAMASYALLGALSGFRYSAVEKALWFGPRVEVRPFGIFFSTASGYGTIRLMDESLRIEMIEGELPLKAVHLHLRGSDRLIPWNILARADHPQVLSL